jgi:hypothetical protein
MPFGVGDFIFKRRFDMRPPAIEKWVLPNIKHVAQLLKTYFKPADSGRLLDPCAGEGTAASILAKALNCQSWGAELSPARAALAAEKMDRLFNTPWGSCHLTVSPSRCCSSTRPIAMIVWVTKSAWNWSS